MERKTIDKELRRKISDSRRWIEALMKVDGNEAATRQRVERIFEIVMGYNAFEHLSRERAVKGAGETEHVDFAVQLEPGPDAEPIIMVELKRVGIDLALKHLKQVTSYAIDAGCEWVLLTNSREWRLYHVEFGQPPKTQLIEQWNLLTDDIVDLATKFELISYNQVRKGSLKKLWEKATVLSPDSLLSALVSKDCINVVRRFLRKHTGVMVASEDLVNGIRKLLNENAAIELSKIEIDFSEKGRRAKRVTKSEGKEPAKTEVAQRYDLRKRFWTQLLQVARQKTQLHANIMPGEYNWVGTGTGLRGLVLNYVATKHTAAVELYIDRGKDAEKENEMIFQQLVSDKEKIEEAFGEGLDWQKLQGKRACRIRKEVALGGYRDEEEKWPQIDEAMVDAMIRLEKALKPFISNLQI